jgi:hypothetical protein
METVPEKNYIWQQPGVDLGPTLDICALRRSFFSYLASCICALRPTHCIFSQIWVHFTLYAVRPTFMKSNPDEIAWVNLSFISRRLINKIVLDIIRTTFTFKKVVNTKVVLISLTDKQGNSIDIRKVFNKERIITTSSNRSYWNIY